MTANPTGYERLELVRLIQTSFQEKGGHVEDLTAREYSRIFDECIRRGHGWTKSRSSAFLKRHWAQMKSDAILHFDYYLTGKSKSNLVKSDVVILQIIEYKSEIYADALNKLLDLVPISTDEQENNQSISPDSSNTVTIEVKSGQPLDFLASGVLSPVEADTTSGAVDMQLMEKLFPNHKQNISNRIAEEQSRKRQLTKEEGNNSDLIDYNLMAALGLPRKKSVAPNPEPALFDNNAEMKPCVAKSVSPSPSANTQPIQSKNRISQKQQQFEKTRTKLEERRFEQKYMQNQPTNAATTVASFSSNESVTIQQKLLESQKQPTKFASNPALSSSNELVALQKRLLEAQIIKEQTITRYYEKKLVKLEKELSEARS